MSYSTIAQCVADYEFASRINACVAQEQLARSEHVQPSAVAEQLLWAVASAADVEAAYASALAAFNEHAGRDPSVITDGMILANVQAHWPTTPPA